ncbi:MAG: class I SAM-dependent methyltransferase [Promethearchaeota archaeon]
MKNDKKKRKKQSKIDFRFMAFFFKIRDKFNPPMIKIEKSEIKLDDHVLDYGCGPGSYSIAAAEIVGPTGKVCAADINPLAIKNVNKKALKKGLQNIEVIPTDCNTGLDDNSMDVVICFDVFHGIEDKKSILREFHRVLKPNSRLSFDDHHMKENELISLITAQGLFKFEEKKEKIYVFSKI